MMLHREDEHLQHVTASISNHSNGLILHSDLGDERSSMDRSSATPSHNDENDPQDLLLDDEAEKEEVALMKNDLRRRIDDSLLMSFDHRLNEMKDNFVYIQHQLSRVMRHLHVTPCSCQTCIDVHQTIDSVPQKPPQPPPPTPAAVAHHETAELLKLTDPAVMLSMLFPNASRDQLLNLVELSKLNKLPSQLVLAPPPSTPTTPHCSQQQQQLHHHQQHSQQHHQQQHHQQPQPAAVQRTGSGYGCHPGGGKMPSGIDRKVVAEYAKIHGGAAAAKKFGVPPPVATYYQRKDSSNSLLPTTPSATGMPQLPMSAPPIHSAAASPGPSSDGDREDNAATPAAAIAVVAAPAPPLSAPILLQQSSVDCSTPTGGPPNLGQPIFSSMVDMLKMNSTHSGSPGFLRGRGRGRPKLIGDELDADLVDYMVTVKQTDPHGHLTASQALQIAKQYILEKAPGLLEEHGGHVKLKLTWAMKLVSRISERQKEIELGLPAGALSNIGRQQLNNLPGGFMADMMSQNLFSQQMLMNLNQMNFSGGPGGINGSGSHSKSSDEGGPLNQNEENMHVATPEILNVKELNFPFLSNLFDSNDKSGLIEGEVSPDDDGMELGLGTV